VRPLPTFLRIDVVDITRARSAAATPLRDRASQQTRREVVLEREEHGEGHQHGQERRGADDVDAPVERLVAASSQLSTATSSSAS
jgi:hypothetical protein